MAPSSLCGELAAHPLKLNVNTCHTKTPIAQGGAYAINLRDFYCLHRAAAMMPKSISWKQHGACVPIRLLFLLI